MERIPNTDIARPGPWPLRILHNLLLQVRLVAVQDSEWQDLERVKPR